MRELFFRGEEDPNYLPDLLEVGNEIEALIYQIKMILGTTRGEVLGEVKFGGDTENLLFSFDFDPGTFSRSLVAQTGLYSELARTYNIQYKIKRLKTDGGGDVGLVDVVVNNKSIFGYLF